MTQSPPPSGHASVKLRKPLWRRLLKWTLRAAIVLVVLGIAAYASVSYWAASTISKEITKIRDAHEPVTLAELDAMTPKVDRSQDAGPYYAAAVALVQPIEYATQSDNDNENAILRDPILGDPHLTPEVLAWAQRNIDANRLSLELLDRGSPLSGCNADIQLNYGMAIALTHLGRPRALLDVVSLRTCVLAIQGNGDAAIDSLISSLGLLRVLDRQPVLIDSLVQWAMLDRICQSAAIILAHGRPSDAALQKLGAALRNTGPITLHRMLIAERAYYLEMIQAAIGSRPPSDYLPLPESQSWESTWGSLKGVRIMIANALPDYARMIKAADADWSTAGAGVQAIAGEPRSIWNSMWLLDSSFSRAVTLGQRAASHHGGILIAIQIERYRLAHGGKLPESLAELPQAELPKDPFNGQSFAYEKTADGYCVHASNQGAPDSAKLGEWLRLGGILVRTNISK